jgi:hypothetical protein
MERDENIWSRPSLRDILSSCLKELEHFLMRSPPPPHSAISFPTTCSMFPSVLQLCPESERQLLLRCCLATAVPLETVPMLPLCLKVPCQLCLVIPADSFTRGVTLIWNERNNQQIASYLGLNSTPSELCHHNDSHPCSRSRTRSCECSNLQHQIHNLRPFACRQHPVLKMKKIFLTITACI